MMSLRIRAQRCYEAPTGGLYIPPPPRASDDHVEPALTGRGHAQPPYSGPNLVFRCSIR